MTPDIVVDIGNSRIKWGWCEGGRVERVSNLGDGAEEWNREISPRSGPVNWAVASVHPERAHRFNRWIESRSESVAVIDSFTQIPLKTDLTEPSRVGIDRLCASWAAYRLHGPGPMLVVQVGTAVVINHVGEGGEFLGGAILPGFRMMAKALAAGTARLPEVDFAENMGGEGGRNTVDAIRNGIYLSIVGACNCSRSLWLRDVPRDRQKTIVTGGDAELLIDKLLPPLIHAPTLTLEGIRLAAEDLP